MKKSKREVIEIGDDSDSGSPVAKRATKAVPSAEVLELRQKVAKLDMDLKVASGCSVQFIFELEKSQKRVQSLEGILAKKRPKFGELLASTDVAGKALERIKRKFIDKLAKKSKKLEQATRDLEAARRSESEMAQEIVALKSEMAETEHAHKEKLLRVKERSRARIGELESQRTELKLKLAEYESEEKLRKVPSMKDSASDMVLEKNHNILDFKPSWDVTETISYDNAARQLSARYFSKDKDWKRKFLADVAGQCNCKLCGVYVKNYEILRHFFTPRHRQKLRAHNHFVSVASFEYWMNKLESIPKPNVIEMITVSSDEDDCEEIDELARELARPKNRSENILEFKPSWKDTETISYDLAAEQLNAAIRNAGDGEWRRTLVRASSQSYCSVCETRPKGIDVLIHFLGRKHATKIRAAKNTVSVAAFEYWMRKLESIQKKPATV